ncbi:cupin domain-containing protein [Streptomyces dangxiongensis]|uniref:pirin family protein n=1 Tax=Streptomyces dangxiongensis TaxID=1442032 RepID=UPI0013CE3F2F|nr:pirin family protein [Streptomyces dangxiongensis]
MTTVTGIDGRVLPTGRASLRHQREVFLGAVRLSGPERLVIKSTHVAKEVGLSGDTVTESLRFFDTLGIVTGARGRYAATEEGVALAEVWPADETRARVMLHHLFEGHWATDAARTALAQGPVEAEALAQHLQLGLPGHPRRGLYVVEWLIEGLIIHPDRHGRVYATSPGQVPPASTLPQPRKSEHEPSDGYVMGMCNEELRRLPTSQYVSVLRSFKTMIEQVDAVPA